MDNKELFEKVKKELFDDWRKKHLNEDGKYDEKLYKVTDKNFIEKCKKNNLCKYEELPDGTFKAALATLNYEDFPKEEREKEEDLVLFDLCLKKLDDYEIAQKLNEVFCKERGRKFVEFDKLSDDDKEYYYNEIRICKKVIRDCQ